MPLNIPNLDDRTFADLVEEAISMIPRYAPEWTNHNPSDPGVTLIELLAYFSEILIYRLNRVTRESKIAFLKLIRDVDTAEEQSLLQAPVQSVDEALREAVVNLSRPQRAVIAEDYEHLALTFAMRDPSGPKIARALCLIGRNLEERERANEETCHPGHVSVVVLPDMGYRHGGRGRFLELVRDELERKRLLTVRLHVTGPHYLFLAIGAKIRIIPGASVDEVKNKALKKLERRFDPFPGGGPDSQGWPFGRTVYLSEIFEQLEDMEEVVEIRGLRLHRLATSEREFLLDVSTVGIQIGVHSTVGADTRLGCFATADTDRLITDTAGRLIAVRLRAHELVKMDFSGLVFHSNIL